jgi:hypothetical protein
MMKSLLETIDRAPALASNSGLYIVYLRRTDLSLATTPLADQIGAAARHRAGAETLKGIDLLSSEGAAYNIGFTRSIRVLWRAAFDAPNND